MIMTEKTIASESGHWYQRDGTPAYTLIGANGKERNTTLRDARKLDLVPSVSGIIKMAAQPGLEAWKTHQLALAMATLPKLDGEDLDAFIDRAKDDARQQSLNAMQKGTDIHGSLEKAYLGLPFDRDHMLYVGGTQEAIRRHFGAVSWSAEKSFAHELGYGGKCDLHHKPEGFSGSIPEGVVVDFKTKEFGPDSLPDTWDEHALQLAAYREGFDMPSARCAIVYVSVSVPGLAVVKELPEEDLERGWRMFVALLTYWKAKNRV